MSSASPSLTELLLACKPCRRVVAVNYFPAGLAQGLTKLDDHTTCGYCGKKMVLAERDSEGRIALPGG